MADFFIKRPVFTIVTALIFLLIGGISVPTLPIAQFPDIAPTQVNVTANYSGASATAVENGVTSLIEREINGVQGMRYVSSSSSNSGTSSISITFDASRDQDIAAVDIQNRVSVAETRLPEEVTRTGITIAKQSGSILLGFGLFSEEDEYDSTFLSNYADLYLVDALKRIDGVEDAQIFGERRYAMRLTASTAGLCRETRCPTTIALTRDPPDGGSLCLWAILRLGGEPWGQDHARRIHKGRERVGLDRALDAMLRCLRARCRSPVDVGYKKLPVRMIVRAKLVAGLWHVRVVGQVAAVVPAAGWAAGFQKTEHLGVPILKRVYALSVVPICIRAGQVLVVVGDNRRAHAQVRVHAVGLGDQDGVIGSLDRGVGLGCASVGLLSAPEHVTVDRVAGSHVAHAQRAVLCVAHFSARPGVGMRGAGPY